MTERTDYQALAERRQRAALKYADRDVTLERVRAGAVRLAAFADHREAERRARWARRAIWAYAGKETRP